MYVIQIGIMLVSVATRAVVAYSSKSWLYFVEYILITEINTPVSHTENQFP